MKIKNNEDFFVKSYKRLTGINEEMIRELYQKEKNRLALKEERIIRDGELKEIKALVSETKALKKGVYMPQEALRYLRRLERYKEA